ncbi:MAG: HNH endonuclease, partial [Planctomycetaceae bacterium]
MLRDYQSARCFYCGREVRQGGDADHFIPWSRYPVDLGHNFVFSHPACNISKRDFLAHPDFLARWRESNLDYGDHL